MKRFWQRGTSGRRQRRGGYTLVEMLLATALSVALLAALWSTFDIFTDLFDKGQAQVERSQLCRALVEQITTDLRAAIQDPIAGSAPEPQGPVPVRRFGLFGSSRELRFDVLQVTPQEANPVPVGRLAGATGDVPEARVPELRTVYYEFRAPGAASQDAEPGPIGLIRRELDFETPVIEEDPLAALAADATIDLLDPAGPRAPQADAPAADPADDAAVWVPEVADVQFRYFDGSGWTGSWNSLQRKSLPVAVEVTLRMAAASASEPAAPEVAGDAPAWEEPLVSEAPEPVGSTVRIVVDLPGSPSYRKPRPLAAATTRPPVRPRVRLPARRTAPRPSARPPVRIAPEQWIRRQSP